VLAAMCLARMTTPMGAERPSHPARHPPGRPVPPESPARTGELGELGSKLATFDWPPPPSPADPKRPSATSPRRKAGSGNIFNASGELELNESASSAATAADMHNRAALWSIRAQIEREKLKQWVAPYPFFGCPMRFSDDYAALQITEDGRFSYSEMCLVQGQEAAEPEACPGKSKALETRRVVTYEGVFTGTYTPPADDDDQQVAAAKKKEATTGKAKTKDNDAEELAAGLGPELAGIEATALVKHEIVEAGGRSRLVLVERGAFRFAITVSPFFHPSHATLKVLARTDRNQPLRGRRLPYAGTGVSSKPVLNAAMTRSNSSVLSRPKPKMSQAGSRMKISRSAALLPSVSPAAAAWAGSSTTSPFRCAGAGSLKSPQGVGQWTMGSGKYDSSSWLRNGAALDMRCSR